MPDAIAAVRAFNRFYTGQLGVLGPGFLRTPHTLGEARVLYELNQAPELEVAELRRRMAIDAGQLSRLLARLEGQGLVARERSPADRRRQVARLTPEGGGAAALLDRRSVEDTDARLSGLAGGDRARLVAALAEVRRLLDRDPPAPRVVLRPPVAGDLGWVIGATASCTPRSTAGTRTTSRSWRASWPTTRRRRIPPARRCGSRRSTACPPGACSACRESDDVARLRLLLVEPRARGLGLGGRLVDECVAFARRAGYREVVLWTQDILVQARRIYQRAGFRLVDEERHHSFGHDLVGQTWSLTL